MPERLPLRAAAPAMFAVLLASCSPAESGEAARVSYDRNVESCLCRSLEFETDSDSGMPYERMLAYCNRTVHSANPRRYPPSAHAAPKIDSLRCPASIEEWRETARAGMRNDPGEPRPGQNPTKE